LQTALPNAISIASISIAARANVTIIASYVATTQIIIVAGAGRRRIRNGGFDVRTTTDRQTRESIWTHPLAKRIARIGRIDITG